MKNVPPVQKGQMKKKAFTQHLGGVGTGFCYLKMTIAGREYHQVHYFLKFYRIFFLILYRPGTVTNVDRYNSDN